jgi:hypothetical protein
MSHTPIQGAVKRGFAKAAVFMFLMTVTSPVLAMSEVEGRTPRAVFVHTESLRRRRRAMDRYYGLPNDQDYQFLSPQFA